MISISMYTLFPFPGLETLGFFFSLQFSFVSLIYAFLYDKMGNPLIPPFFFFLILLT